MGFLGTNRLSAATGSHRSRVRVAAALVLLILTTSSVGFSMAGGARGAPPQDIAPGVGPLSATSPQGPPTTAELGIQDLVEYFISPLTGTAYRIYKDADRGTKTYCGTDGACYRTTDEILALEAQALPPWARAVEPALRARVAAGESSDVIAIIELKDATFARVSSEVWDRVSNDLNALESKILYEQASTGSMPQRADLERLNAMTDAARAEIYLTARQELAPLVDMVRGQVESLGGDCLGYTPVLPAVFARIPISSIPALATRPAVLWISQDRPVQALMDVSVYAMGADTYWTNGYTGGVWDLAVEDTGIDSTHPAFASVNIQANVFHAAGQFDPNYADQPANPDDLHGHGTHVGGTVASNDGTYRGVAYGLNKLINAKAGWLTTGGGGVMFTTDGMSGVDWAIQTAGADVISLSFGGGSAGDTAWERFFDAVVDDLGVAVAIAAGNSGPGSSSVGDPGAGYNILSVAAIDDSNTRTRTDDGVVWWSSRGPTLDGRLKPDIGAPGVDIMSCNAFWEGGGNPDFVPMGGTSMATPHMAAAYILLMDGQGVRTPLLHKALLLNTATDLGMAGPDNANGWGYVDLTKAFTYRNDVVEGDVSDGAVHYVFYRGSVATGDKATLVWNRHATYNGANFPTVYYPLNDLDLYAYDETNNGRLSSSTRTLDNVEQVSANAAYPSFVIKVHADGAFSGVTQEHYAIAFQGTKPVVAPPSLSVSASAPPSEELGNAFTVTADVLNSGGLNAHSVLVTLNLPPGLRVVSGANPQGIGRVLVGSSVRASWQVVGDTTGLKTLSADASSNSYDETFAASGAPQSVLIIDTTPPLSFVNPLPANTTVGSFDVTATASDLSGVANVELWFRKDGGAWTSYGTDSATPWLWTFDTTGTGGDGLYEYYSIATDRSSIRETEPAIPDASTLVDTTPPISTTDPLPTYTVTTSFDVNASASDARIGVGNVTLYARRAGGTWALFSTDTAAPWSWTFDSLLAGGDGVYEFYTVAGDLLGNMEVKAFPSVEASTTVDTTPPVTSDALNGIPGMNGWYRSNVTVTLTAFDVVSGTNTTQYRVDGGPWQTYAATFLVVGEGSHTVEFYSTDFAGNAEIPQSVQFRLDTQAPTTNGTLAGTPGTNGWYTTNVTVTLNASDSPSGVTSVTYQIDGGPLLVYPGPFLVTGEGNHGVVFYSTDEAGNVEDSQRADFRVDTIGPTSGQAVSGTPGNGGWYTTNVTVTLTASDGLSGVNATRYRIDGGPWQTYAGLFNVGDEGSHVVEFFTTDMAGNREIVQSVTFKVDTTPPDDAIAAPGAGAILRISSVTLTWSAVDNVSGLSACYVVLNGGTVIPVANDTSYTFNGLQDGSHRATVTCADMAGNTAQKEVRFSVDTKPVNPFNLLALFTNVWFLLIIAAMVAIVLIAAALRRRRRKEEAAPPSLPGERPALRYWPPPPPPPELDEMPEPLLPPPPPPD